MDPAGNEVALRGADTVNPTFTPYLSGTYTASLQVIYGTAASLLSQTTAVATITANARPTVADWEITTDEDTVWTDSTGGMLGINATNVDSADFTPNQILTFAIATNGSKGQAAMTDPATGAFTYTPNPDANGTDTFTYKANDGLHDSVAGTVTVTINPVNDPPTVSDIVNQTTALSTAKSVGFTANDPDTAQAALVVTATSNNPALIPNTSLVVTGTTASRTLKMTPVADQTGTAVITVNVDDGQYTATDSFVLTVGTNSAPTISDIADQTTNEDVSLSGIAFTVADADTPLDNLLITATSSDTTLVPNANLVIGGTGGNRSLSITPAANQNGTATITVSVSDGNLTATDTLALTVTAVNDAPTISDIPNRGTPTGTSTGAIAFTIGDVDTALTGLTVTAASDNQTLVPDANLLLGGSGASRTLTVTPVAAQSGTATITVTVDDGSLTASDTFLLTVNAAPTISDIGNRAINQDAATGAIPFTVSDAETALASLVVTASSTNQGLVPDGSLVIGGADGNRTLNITPVTGQSGSSTITVTVSDGALSASDTFVLTVNGPPSVSVIADQNTVQGQPTAAIPFTVADAETVLSSLTVTATSSNQTLIPDANLVLGGSDGSRTLTITPAAGQSGTATITITVTDSGGLSAISSLGVTVNGTPTVTSILDQTTTEDTPISGINFTVGDPETAASSLVVTVSSDNQALAPNASLLLLGSGSSRTLTITPGPNQSGSAVITVAASDGSSSGSTSFTFSVTAQNDPPTISNLPDLVTNEDTAVSAIPFAVNDIDTALSSLNVTAVSDNQALIPDANLVLGGSDGSRTLSVTPAANQHGTATITVTVSDGSLSASNSLVVTVNSISDAPVNILAPSIAGLSQQGATLTLDQGNWANASNPLATVVYSLAWQRDSDGTGSTSTPQDIAGQTGTEYILGADDVGSYVRAKVTATANGESTVVYTDYIGPITAAP